MRGQVWAGIAAAALVAWGCGASSYSSSSTSGGAGTTTGSSSGLTVTMGNMRFSPATMSISAGQTVTWHNTDSIDHTVTAGAPGAETGQFDQVLHPGASFTYTFSQTGAFKYFCRYHASMGMTGEVDVGTAQTTTGGGTTTGQTTTAGSGY